MVVFTFSFLLLVLMCFEWRLPSVRLFCSTLEEFDSFDWQQNILLVGNSELTVHLLTLVAFFRQQQPDLSGNCCWITKTSISLTKQELKFNDSARMLLALTDDLSGNCCWITKTSISLTKQELKCNDSARMLLALTDAFN